MVLQSVKNIVENTQWKMHDFDSEYVFSTSSVKYVVENECSPSPAYDFGYATWKANDRHHIHRYVVKFPAKVLQIFDMIRWG